MRTSAAFVCTLIVTASACGGSADNPSPSATARTETDAEPGSTDNAFDFTVEPRQLAVDPCTLVTKAEAETLLGPVNDTDSGTYDPPKCIYVSSENTGGQLAVSLTEPDFCKLLFLALDLDMFSDVQERIDDIGAGGMLVKGNGNVQFVVAGGCIEVAGNVDHDTPIDDVTILRLAKTAAERAA